MQFCRALTKKYGMKRKVHKHAYRRVELTCEQVHSEERASKISQHLIPHQHRQPLRHTAIVQTIAKRRPELRRRQLLKRLLIRTMVEGIGPKCSRGLAARRTFEFAMRRHSHGLRRPYSATNMVCQGVKGGSASLQKLSSWQ